jgi:hypothetical protein
MRKIKSYEEFINEEISLKKLLTNVALMGLGFTSPTISQIPDKSIQQEVKNDNFTKELKNSIVFTISPKVYQMVDGRYEFKRDGEIISLNKVSLKKDIEEAIEMSKEWWRSHLSLEKTKNRLQNYNSLTDEELETTLKNYLNIINNFELHVFDSQKIKSADQSGTLAMVVEGFKDQVFLNITNLNRKTVEQISVALSHELGHLIDYVMFTSPDAFIESTFNPGGKKYSDTLQSVKNNFEIDDNQAKKYIEALENAINSYKNIDRILVPIEMNAWKGDMQRFFGGASKSEGYNIKIEDLKEYIEKVLIPISEGRNPEYKWSDSSVDFFLINWVLQGFPELDTYLKQINKLTKVDIDWFDVKSTV